MEAYRFEIQYFDEGIHSFEIKERKYHVIGETPCGFYIMNYGKKKWVPCTGVNRPFCHKNKQEALVALQKRREKHGKLLKWSIKANDLHLEAINKALGINQQNK